MTGKEFEIHACNVFKALGYWALNIPRNQTGAQPFDILAIKGNEVIAVDCKVCGKDSFVIDRIEDNQWSSFNIMDVRTNADIGILAYYAGDIYFITYGTILDCMEVGMKSIKLTKKEMWLTKEDIEKLLNKRKG